MKESTNDSKKKTLVCETTEINLDHLDGKEFKRLKFYEQSTVHEAVGAGLGEVINGIFKVLKNG